MDQIQSNNCTDFGSNAGQLVKEAGDHDAGLSSTEEDTPKCFPRLFWKILMLASLCLATVQMMITQSMIVPFYPQEAQARGVSASVVGLVFGTYALAGFFSAPICGMLISKYGAIRVLCVGTLLCGTAMILFGFCAWISNATAFVVSSLLCRAVGAFGGTACETSTMSIGIGEFPERVAMASGFIETSVGVGLSLGPVLGGGLYTVGGFPLPFFVIGCVTIIIIPVLYCAFSSDCELHSSKSDGQEDKKDGLFPIVKAFKIPAVWMIAVCLATTGLLPLYIQPIFGPHLEKTMNLNSAQIGLVFFIDTMVYAIVSPLAGWIGDKTKWYRWFSVAGYIGVGFACFLIGPAPFLTFFLPSKRVWLVYVAMTVFGISMGVYSVQLVPDLVAITRAKGMPDNSATRGVISSIFSGMINLGATIGPILAGIFDQHIGFQWAMVVAGIISFSQALVLVAFTLFQRIVDSRTKEPYSPIIDNSSEGEEELEMDSCDRKKDSVPDSVHKETG